MFPAAAKHSQWTGVLFVNSIDSIAEKYYVVALKVILYLRFTYKKEKWLV